MYENAVGRTITVNKMIGTRYLLNVSGGNIVLTVKPAGFVIMVQ